MMEEKMLILIALLSKYSEEYKDNLISMFKKYVYEDIFLKEFILKLDNTLFYHRKGEELYGQIVESIHNYTTDIDNIQTNRIQLQNKKEYLNEVLNLNLKFFNTLEVKSGNIDFITKDNEIKVTKYYKSYINILIYMLLITMDSDFKVIEYPSIDNSSNLNDVIRNVLLPQLLSNNNTKTWVISPTYPKTNEFKISIKYTMQYTNLSFLDILQLYEDKVYFAPNIFYNAESDSIIGYGNIVSFDYRDTVSVIDSLIAREIPQFLYQEDFIINHDPIHNLKLVIQNNDFIINPLSYVEFLNSLLDSKTVCERKKKNQCFICGKNIDYGLTCDKHKIVIK
jgi:hypothetical protein